MAEITKTPIISISTGEAVKNVKELKDNIKALKEQLDNAETSTADYSDIVKQLSQNQAALRNVMNGVNSTFTDSITAAQGLGTSYNSLVQQLKQATQEWRAIPKYLSDADQAAGKVNQAWTDAAKKVYDLRTELKNMDADTNSFVRNVGNYKSALEGFSGSMKTVKQVGGDMVNGLQSAASTFALLGVNTDGLNDSMKNLRIILAAVQGAKGFAGLISQLRSYFKAGKQAARATTEQAAAQTAANVATEAGTVAMSGLQKALLATGIGALVVALGALVAHFEDIVKWVGNVGERMGWWKKETDKAKEANEKLKNSLETQNRAFENQAKILRAQGSTNKEILLQKKELIKSQINETKAAIAAAEARIKQLEADHRWWKFWQGTKGKVEKELENIKEWNESLKNLTNSLEDIDVDIKVEDITAGRNAAERATAKAKKDAEDALNTAKKLLGDAGKVVDDALKAEENELDKIIRVHKERVDLINSALTATKDMKELEADRAKLEQNKDAEDRRYRAELEAYYRKDFEGKAAEKEKEHLETYERIWDGTERYHKVLEEIFKQTPEWGKGTYAQENALMALDDTIQWLRDELKKNGVSALDLIDAKSMNRSEISKKWAEPIATQIKLYLDKSKEFEDLSGEILKKIFSDFEENINVLVGEGRFEAARRLADVFKEQFGRQFSNELTGKKEFETLFKQIILDPINEAAQESPRVGILESVINDNDINKLKKDVETAKVILDEWAEEVKDLKETGYFDEFLGWKEDATNEQLESIKNYEDALLNLNVLEERLFKLRIKRFEENAGEVAKYFNSYGKSTSNLLDNVADAWEASLQAQVKAGKRSEESAKDSFETMKTLQYASAVINTAAAVVQALADPSVPSYYVKVINAAAALAAGTAQVIKIANTEFSSTASAAGGETPRLVQQAPAIQYTVGVNEADYAAAQAQNPIHCYITDKELNDGLEQYNARENETTF